MASTKLPVPRGLGPFVLNQSLLLVRVGWAYRSAPPRNWGARDFSTHSLLYNSPSSEQASATSAARSAEQPDSSKKSATSSSHVSIESHKPDWDENPDFNISAFSQLPHSDFGFNQHMIINHEFKEALRQILWQFRAPIRYAFAYGSGVFPQHAPSTSKPSSHPSPSPAIAKAQGGQGKMIDMIFGVSYTQHWHSLNLQQHRDHYSLLGSLGSGMVSRVQDRWGAGVYFNPYVTVNGTLIKYGVVNLDTLCKDLSEWDTLYLAGRLQKPVKILRDDPRVRLANQVNLISALRTALLLLPSSFDERQLYTTIANISYLGDPRIALRTENPQKIANIVSNQMANFRRLYAPLIDNLPNVTFKDSHSSSRHWEDDSTINATLNQDMDPVKRGNMVRRLPKSFREKLYFQYQSKFQIAQLDFDKMMQESSDETSTRIKRRQGGVFEQRVAGDTDGLKAEVSETIKKTIGWPSTSQTMKGLLTAGVRRSWRYLSEKGEKWREGRNKAREEHKAQASSPGPGEGQEKKDK
ncbi:MAG: Mitochondrial translocator assembly and maintenance protein 41 [Caeruleum heppii]|nr:MAG: Mitochondrial translocator assembly and maintenance protein 41 [Caeruleum heppii]